MTTRALDDLLADLHSALEEVHRRFVAAAAAGQTRSDEPKRVVVVGQAEEALRNPEVLAAVERLARLGRKANIAVEVHSGIHVETGELRAGLGSGGLLLGILGGSNELCRYVLDPTVEHVTYHGPVLRDADDDAFGAMRQIVGARGTGENLGSAAERGAVGEAACAVVRAHLAGLADRLRGDDGRRLMGEHLQHAAERRGVSHVAAALDGTMEIRQVERVRAEVERLVGLVNDVLDASEPPF